MGSKILRQDGTVFFDTNSGPGIQAAAAASGSGYYVVTAVDTGGTESVQSLAVKPASIASAGSSMLGCFIGASGQLTALPSLLIWVLLILTVAMCIWRKAQGARRKV